jgi:hypothetical protein
MDKILNYKTLLLPVAIFVILSPSFSGIAFAEDPNGMYSHSHITATWDHGYVCGDHKCAPGEMPHNPPVVVPVKGIR